MRPRELKKLEHEARCTLLDAERSEFVALVGLIVGLVPLTLEAQAANYVRIRLRQPETEQRLHRLLALVSRVVIVHFPDWPCRWNTKRTLMLATGFGRARCLPVQASKW